MNDMTTAGKRKKRKGGGGGAGRTRTKHNGELCTEDETPWETKGDDMAGSGLGVFAWRLGGWGGGSTVELEGAEILEMMCAFIITGFPGATLSE